MARQLRRSEPVRRVRLGLLAQDELQCVEHPALGSIREALEHENLAAWTEEDLGPTPVLVANVERRCTLETAASLARPFGLYGNQFARARRRDDPRRVSCATIRRARSNLIAIAAPVGSGRYTRAQIERVIVTAFTGFAAAVHESRRAASVEICTGFWGCGAFGGNRELMTALQLFAARLAGVARVTFYAFDDAGPRRLPARSGRARPRSSRGRRSVAEVIDRIDAAGYAWGVEQRDLADRSRRRHRRASRS